MKTIYRILFFFILVTQIYFAQDLPHQMTEEEKQLWQNYQPLLFPEFSEPPPTPVRTMAEWEELQGILITWTSYTSILRQIVDYAQEEGLVYIVCSDSNSVKNYLSAGGVPLVNLKFLITSFNSIWVRDYGPWSVYSGVSDTLKIIDWIYNRPRPLDDVIPVFFANYTGLPIYQTTTPPYDLIASGGNFMTDGHGTGFSSKLILNENSGKTEAQINLIMNKFMGLDRYIKMETLPYDQIHHIDMHMKLLDEETLLVGQYPPGVADGPQIEANLQYVLNNFLTCYGRPFKVVRIPMPPENGQYPPSANYRTYTNSLIINKTVIVPTYELQYDTTALRIYREAMPGYRIVGINSNSIIPALGTIHCITKEIGVTEPVYISHPKLSGIIVSSDSIEIKAYIKTKSGIEDAFVYWTTDTTSGFTQLSMNETNSDTFKAYIPAQIDGIEVYYYISASSFSGRTVTKPLTAPAGFYSFEISNNVPVELISFSADINNSVVTLNWRTATELNNKGYEIERLQHGNIEKMNDWKKVGFVPGSGTTTEPKFYSFKDDLSHINNPSFTLDYRLKQIDYDGSFAYSQEIKIDVNVPNVFSLEQNYPNPFNPSTKIKYSIPEVIQSKIEKCLVTLKVYDILGNEISTLVNEEKPAGNYEVEFNANNLVSGVYFYQLKIYSANNNDGAFIQTKKMVLIR
ncbi:MAG: agmatine deiminase family protein [Ignavibacterium sp.]|nr:agmatine deiminase family protein [Ignavibacterium sp.]